jgi:hypothetical protein
LLVAHLCLGAPNLSAAESKPPDGFEQVRKGLDAVKAQPEVAKQTAPNLGSSVMPDWQAPGPPPARTTPSPGKNLGREGKSSNWLLEAMNPSTLPDGKSDSGASPASATGPDGSLTPREVSRRPDPGPSALGSEQLRGAAPLPGQAAAPDPFARFLGGWMTPQDYALLRPSISTSENTPQGPNREIGTSAPTSNVQTSDLSAVLRANTTGEAAKPRALIPTARVNPYLPALEPAEISAAGATVKARTESPPPVTPANALPSPATVPAPPKVPTFHSTTDDEKYFKQLKRF